MEARRDRRRQRRPAGGVRVHVRRNRLAGEAARPLPLSAVRLTGGPLKHAQELDAQYLLKLEPDRMLAFFRKRAGLEPKALPYGGWDGDGKNLTGHIAGHYLSAVSLMWAATGDARFKERADYIVKELKEVQDAQGDGYLGALANGKELGARTIAGVRKNSACRRVKAEHAEFFRTPAGSRRPDR